MVCFLALWSRGARSLPVSKVSPFASKSGVNLFSTSVLKDAAISTERKEDTSKNIGGISPALLLICGPSGVGKGTLCNLLLSDEHLGPKFAFSVSHTSRSPRQGEVDGRHYHFVSDEEFAHMASRGEFLEHTRAPHGVWYGTSRAELQRLASLGKIGLLDVDLDGVRNLRAAAGVVSKLPQHAHGSQQPLAYPAIDVRCVGVLPPGPDLGLASLEERLRGRGTESEDQITKRISRASSEIRAICDDKDPIVDAKIINQDSWQVGFPELRRLVVRFWPALDLKK